ncbi:hypothetical protein HTSR_1648 [Halodesulfurarchaeum formicicum]|uniref:Uncharacterized protein n=1 Tax=Halodesulfurarchaeum formicicum TaxID=1873524 RepID=A0A1D8S660_9EURY|nr:DUF5807 family protein [Halodesulfurarchaeum formicicum]AOW80819.1 hypothetical protein HTSR_1648 [Halodesulfurarchaeum formicicum]APE96155.1 hypothetical protein HSR6_1717 [Halodesulfurarchaeum formicicum]
MNTDIEAFLSGDRPDHVAAYLSRDATDVDSLADQPYASPTDNGVLLVVPGDAGRSAFQSATGTDPMAFASEAMATDGHIDRSLTDADCPDEGDGETHELRLLFAFAEEQNEDVDGLYAEGDVIHAYAQCSCGLAYADKWVADGR